jgi:DNA-directed RNA polymerase specialized sigma24 family protein
VRPEIDHVIQLIQRNDRKSLEEALRLLQKIVSSFSIGMGGQRQDAEDTMQEVLFKSVPYLPKFDSPKALMVWLYKVAKNRCLMSRRKSKFASREDPSLEELMPDRQELQRLSGSSDGTPETSLLHRESAKRLRQAVERYLRLIAGAFVLVSLALGYWVSPCWFLLSAFVGLNLFQRLYQLVPHDDTCARQA